MASDPDPAEIVISPIMRGFAGITPKAKDNLVRPTREQLEAKRAALLAELGTTAEELRARRKAADLSGDEHRAVIELDELDFLLGSD
jgi:hypothetical protein